MTTEERLASIEKRSNEIIKFGRSSLGELQGLQEAENNIWLVETCRMLLAQNQKYREALEKIQGKAWAIQNHIENETDRCPTCNRAEMAREALKADDK